MQSIKYMVGKCFVGDMPQVFQHPVLAQEANCCSHNQSGHLQKSQWEWCLRHSGWVMTRTNLAFCFAFEIQKWRNLCSTHGLLGCADVSSHWVHTCEAACGQPCRTRPESFFLAKRRSECTTFYCIVSSGTVPLKVREKEIPLCNRITCAQQCWKQRFCPIWIFGGTVEDSSVFHQLDE